MKMARWSCWLLVAAVLGCGQSKSASPAEGGAVSPSPFRPATATELDALLKAWCDWDTRCSPDSSLATCDERRSSMGKPELYVADPVVALTKCLDPTSCSSVGECIRQVALATLDADPSTATYTSSRGTLFNSCGGRMKECTVQGALTKGDCYWTVFFADAVLPKVQACLAQPCTQYHSCAQALTR